MNIEPKEPIEPMTIEPIELMTIEPMTIEPIELMTIEPMTI